MNILFVHEINWMRDPIWEIHILAELLSRRGHNVYAVDYGSTRESTGLFSPTKELDIARVHPDAKVCLVNPAFIKIPAISRLSYSLICHSVIHKVITEHKIDTVILYSAPTNGLQTIRVARRFGVPIIFRSIDALHKLVPAPLSLPTKLLEGLVYRNVDRILTITPALSRYVENLGAKKNRVGILPLGVGTDPLSGRPKSTPRRFGGATGSKILFAGTLPHFSGLADFLRLFPDILREIPTATLLIVGDGPQRHKLERIAKNLGLEDKVTITGLVPHKDVPHYVQQAAVCINTFPTTGATRDILPTKVLQYMAGGKPVVSTPLQGMLDMGIGESQGVLYVKNGDWVSPLTTALRNRDELGKVAREYVVRNHSYDRVIEQLEQEIEELCERSH